MGRALLAQTVIINVYLAQEYSLGVYSSYTGSQDSDPGLSDFKGFPHGKNL